MTVPASQPIQTVAPSPPRDSLEAVELELVLQASDDLEAALGQAGAKLLFRVHEGGAPDAPFSAAVVVGEGAERRFLIVRRPAGGAVSVEPVETSGDPLARLAPSFAAVMERWPG